MNDHVEIAGRGAIVELNLGRVQTLLQTLLVLRVSLSQALLQLLDGWRLDEHEDRVEMGIPDLLHSFDLDVQDADLPVFLNVLDGFSAKKNV